MGSSVIKEFRDEYFFLSNFYPAVVHYRGFTYMNSEAAFQAQKCLDDDDRLKFCTLEPNEAKRLGRKVRLRDDWEEIKYKFMLEIVRAKFRQDRKLRESLLKTGNAELIEGNTWGDRVWGVDLKTGRGKNN